MSFIYIASPYAHESATVRECRFQAVMCYTAHLMQKGIACYSPITYFHQIALTYSLPKDWDYWKMMDLPLLAKASAMHVLCLDGFAASKGVEAEVEFAATIGILPEYVPPSKDVLMCMYSKEG